MAPKNPKPYKPGKKSGQAIPDPQLDPPNSVELNAGQGTASMHVARRNSEDLPDVNNNNGQNLSDESIPPRGSRTRRPADNCYIKLPTLTDEEADFFQKLSSGDTGGVREFLLNHRIKIDAKDRTGYTALHVAVRRQDESMVELLLNEFGALPFDTLFHAIKEENVQITKELLKRYAKPPDSINEELRKYGIKTSIHLRLFNAQGGGTKLLKYDTAFHEVLTPLMLAAQMGNTELIELFYERGERLEQTPKEGKNPDSVEGLIHHNVGCPCPLCVRVKGDSDLTKAYRKYHVLKALSQPNYILFLARKEERDPVMYAIQKILKVRLIMRTDRAFTPFFEDFETRLEQFISKMLQCCRNSREVEVFMCPKDDDKLEKLNREHPRLWYAVSLKLKNFVAQPNCQTLVYNMWAGDDWPEWESKKLYVRFFILLGFVVFFSVTSIVNLFGSCDIGFKDIPLRRFMNYVGAYVWFLIMVVVQANLPYQRCNSGGSYLWTWWTDGISIKDEDCKNRGPPYIITEFIIPFFVIGYFVTMAKRMKIGWYWSVFWNYLDLLSQLCFLITFAFWGFSLYKIEFLDDESTRRTHRWNWDPNCSELWGECMIGVCVLLTTFQGMRLLIPLKNIGPLIIQLLSQFKDFLCTVGIIGIIIFAFSSGLMAIYVPYDTCWGHDLSDAKYHKKTKPVLHNPFNTFLSLVFNLYGHGGPDLTKMLAFNKTNNISYPTDLETQVIHHKWSEWIGNVMFIAWTMIGSTMIFGMVTGYMSHRKEQYDKKMQEEWKFAKTELYLTFTRDTMMPPPLNMIEPIICKGFGYYKTKRDKEKREQKKKEDQYRSLVTRLMVRYQNMLEDEQGENLASKDDVKEIGEELAEIKALFKDNKRDDDNNNDGGGSPRPGTSKDAMNDRYNTPAGSRAGFPPQGQGGPPSPPPASPQARPPPASPQAVPLSPPPPQRQEHGPSPNNSRGARSPGGSQHANNAKPEAVGFHERIGPEGPDELREDMLSLWFITPEDYLTNKCTTCSVRPTAASRLQSDQVRGNPGKHYMSSVANLSPKKFTNGLIDFTESGDDESGCADQTLRGSAENGYVGRNSNFMNNFSGYAENQFVMSPRSVNSVPNRDPRYETSTGSIGNTSFSRPDTLAGAECRGPEYSSNNLNTATTPLYDGWNSIRELSNGSTLQSMPEAWRQSETTDYRTPSQQNAIEATPRGGDSRQCYAEPSGIARIDDERRYQTVPSSSRNTNQLTVEAGFRNSSRSKGQYSSQNSTFQPPHVQAKSTAETKVGRFSKPSQVPSVQQIDSRNGSGLELSTKKTSVLDFTATWGPHSSQSHSQRQTNPVSSIRKRHQSTYAQIPSYSQNRSVQIPHDTSGASGTEQQRSNYSNTDRSDYQGAGFPAEPIDSRNGPSQYLNGPGSSPEEEWLRWTRPEYNYNVTDTVGARRGSGTIDPPDMSRNPTTVIKPPRYRSPPTMENIYRDMTLEQGLNQPWFDSPTDLSSTNVRPIRMPHGGQAFSPSNIPSTVPSVSHNKPTIPLNFGSSETGNATDGSSRATGISENLTHLKDCYRRKTDDSMFNY